MCKKKYKITDEQKEALRCARRDKRSAFLSRLVDEFKKIAFIALFFVLVGGIIWCLILMGLGIAVNYLFPLGLSGSLVTIFGVYCAASTSSKNSLNKNNMVKNKDGTFSKIVSTVANVVSNAVDQSNDDEAKG